MANHFIFLQVMRDIIVMKYIKTFLFMKTIQIILVTKMKIIIYINMF